MGCQRPRVRGCCREENGEGLGFGGNCGDLMGVYLTIQPGKTPWYPTCPHGTPQGLRWPQGGQQRCPPAAPKICGVVFRIASQHHHEAHHGIWDVVLLRHLALPRFTQPDRAEEAPGGDSGWQEGDIRGYFSGCRGTSTPQGGHPAFLTPASPQIHPASPPRACDEPAPLCTGRPRNQGTP